MQSIYEYILSVIDENGKVPCEKDKLPDEDTWNKKSKLSFIAGAYDGISWAHMLDGKLPPKIAKICDKFYNTYKGDHQAIFDAAKKLILISDRREEVKSGILLMAYGDVDADTEILYNIAKQEEFTLYVAMTFMKSSKQANFHIYNLTKYVSGWGKIELVEYLEPENDEIKTWLLESGCENTIMPEYLALVCAQKGDMAKALNGVITDTMYDGICTIMSALAAPSGPCDNIDEYADAAKAVLAFLNQSEGKVSTVHHLEALITVKDFLSDDENNWTMNGWNKDIKDDCLKLCEKIISDDKWKQIILSVLYSEDNYIQHIARKVAKDIGIDVWDNVFSQLKELPLDYGLYLFLMESKDLSRIKRLVDFAAEHLPLLKIASGPSNEIWGEDYHHCIDSIVQSLKDFKGIGIQLVNVALWSPVIRNRNMALNVLQAWGSEYWNDETFAVLKRLKKAESNKDIKKRLKLFR